MAQPLTPLGSALAGALGAVFSNAVVYPLDTVKTRLQALPPSELAAITAPPRPSIEQHAGALKLVRALQARSRRWAMLSMLVSIVRTEGLAGAFKGFGANMINTFSQQFAYFFFHTFLRTSALKRSPTLSTSAELALGALAGALAQVFTIPVAVIATRQQLFTSSTARAPGLLETARDVVAEGGPTALWTGLRPGLVLTANPAITYGLFERGKRALLARRSPAAKLGVAEAFWLGVAAKTLATVVTYPYIFAKVRLQAKSTKASPPPSTAAGEAPAPPDPAAPASYAAIAAHPPASESAVVAGVTDSSAEVLSTPAQPDDSPRKSEKGALALLRHVYREHGMKGWYQGMEAQIVKAVLCQGILFVSKDQFESYASTLLGLLGRA
ncbi:hypothetical protein Q5752_006195 [Cryptotrichosporon argae]